VFGQYLHFFLEESDLESDWGMTSVVSTQAPALIFGHVPPQKKIMSIGLACFKILSFATCKNM
jgi:hypothetical protein